MKKSIVGLLTLLLFINPFAGILQNNMNVFAVEWPSDVSVLAQSAILMDADSGAVLYGKNIHEMHFPASITKILTALVIVENCDLNEELTFSYASIHDVEENSSNAGFAVGDTITVRDALYALLLKSANEAANALAEHCSGSVEEFCKLMNERAKSLGCTNSNFENPSGLNNENHYVSAYDYALISKAAFDNSDFVEIDSTTFYHLPKTKNYPEGQTIYSHHAMLKRSNQLHYPGIFGGKTGYTTLAGNTLVTAAQRDGLRLITVVLKSQKTHYQDTKALLDFGFSKFKSVEIAQFDPDFLNLLDDIDLIKDKKSSIRMEDKKSMTLLKDAQLVDIERTIDYTLNTKDPAGAIAKISYSYDDRVIGSTYLISNLLSPTEHIASNVKSNVKPSGGNESDIAIQTIAPFSTEESQTIAVNELGQSLAVSKESSSDEGKVLQETKKANSDSPKKWMRWIEEYLYIIYVIATLLILLLLVLLLKLILFIRDRISIGRRRRMRDAKRKRKYMDY